MPSRSQLHKLMTQGVTSDGRTWASIWPTPTTTSISPTTKANGSAAFTLTVNGTNFTPASNVVFNNVDVASTIVSATQMTCTISTALLGAAGSKQVKARTGPNVSNAQTMTVT